MADDKAAPSFKLPDPAMLSRNMADIASRSQRIVLEFLKRQGDDALPGFDPTSIGSAFLEMTARMMANPAKLVQAQLGFWQDYMLLWQNTARRLMGETPEPVVSPHRVTDASSTRTGTRTRSSTSSSRAICSRPAGSRRW